MTSLIDDLGFEPLENEDIGFEPVQQPKKKKQDSVSGLKEVPKQAAIGGLQGVFGTYGDILDFLGLQSKEPLSGDAAQYEREFRATPEQLPWIIETEDPVPRFSRFPSGEEVGQFLGAPDPETTSGRYARRIGRLAGGGPATGAALLKAPIVAGSIGQTLEEVGAPGWAQAAGEIIGFLSGRKTKTPVSAKSPEVQNKINELRKLGFSEEDVTLAKNALEDRGFLKKYSKLTPQAEKAFKDTLGKSEGKINEMLQKAFPGIEEGLPSVKEASAELYTTLDKVAKDIVIENPDSFVKEASKAVNELKKTLANTPQEKQVIELLEKAMQASGEYPTADHFINFFQGMNQVGNWSNPRQRENVFRIIKDSIKQTFKDQGPEGRKLAELFEEANHSWKRFRQAEDVTELLGKAASEEGTNFSKLAKLLDNPTNFKVIEEGLGKPQTINLKQIADTGSSIKDLHKAIQGGLVKEALTGGKLYGVAKALVTGDLSSLKAIVGAEVLGNLATKLLTDPKWQNLQKKALQAVKDGKFDQLRAISMEAERQL